MGTGIPDPRNGGRRTAQGLTCISDFGQVGNEFAVVGVLKMSILEGEEGRVNDVRSGLTLALGQFSLGDSLLLEPI